MEHFDITRVNLTGYSKPIDEPLYLDHFGHQVYAGDEIYEYNDDVYLVEELSQDAIDIIKHNGGVRTLIF